MKNFCRKCASLFEGETFGKDRICGDCQKVLKKLGFPITAELPLSSFSKKKVKKNKSKKRTSKKRGK